MLQGFSSGLRLDSGDHHHQRHEADVGLRPLQWTYVAYNWFAQCIGAACPNQTLPEIPTANLLDRKSIDNTGTEKMGSCEEVQQLNTVGFSVEDMQELEAAVREEVIAAWQNGEEITVWTDALPQNEAQSHLVGVATGTQSLNDIISSLRADARKAWQFGEEISIWVSRHAAGSTDAEELMEWYIDDERAVDSGVQLPTTEVTEEQEHELEEIIKDVRIAATQAWQEDASLFVFSDRRLAGSTHMYGENAAQAKSKDAGVVTPEQMILLDQIICGMRMDVMKGQERGELISVFSKRRAGQ